MKPYTITFENGHKIVILDKTIEQIKESSGSFAKYGKMIDNKFQSCQNMSFTISKATEEEIKAKKDWINQVEKEYNEVCKYNAKVDRYNSALMKATNHHEFMNAANHLR